jgi:hypothetical protein
MGITVAIALGALFASLAPLVGMYFVLRDKRHEDEDERMERSLDRLEAELARCRQRCNELGEENVRLMRIVVNLKGAQP